MASFEAKRAEKRKGGSAPESGGKRTRSETEGGSEVGASTVHDSPKAGTSSAPAASSMRSYVSNFSKCYNFWSGLSYSDVKLFVLKLKTFCKRCFYFKFKVPPDFGYYCWCCQYWTDSDQSFRYHQAVVHHFIQPSTSSGIQVC